jgi:TolB protein
MRTLSPSQLFIYGLAALLLGACRGNDSPAEKEAPAPHYRLAYNVYVPDSLRPDDYEIFTMELDGSDKQNVTDHPDVAWTYLAHDDHIFFISDRDTASRHYFLYEMSFDGSGVRRISDLRLQDSWMDVRKEGAEIIVMPHPGVDSVFYLISRDGRLLQKIPVPVPYVSDPAFSPDGGRIAFRGSNKRSKREAGYEEAIYVSRLDGSELIKISNYPERDTTAEWYAYKAGPPRWHPGGDFITYQSKQNGKYSLYAASPDGSREWKLTQNPQSEGWHCWSPDGKWLALDVFDVEETQFNIGLINWETKELRILTDSTFHYQQAPVFVERH